MDISLVLPMTSKIIIYFNIVYCTDDQQHPELEYLASFSFYGKIYGMESVRLRHHDRDSLFICFADAKVSVNSNRTTIL